MKSRPSDNAYSLRDDVNPLDLVDAALIRCDSIEALADAVRLDDPAESYAPINVAHAELLERFAAETHQLIDAIWDAMKDSVKVTE